MQKQQSFGQLPLGRLVAPVLVGLMVSIASLLPAQDAVAQSPQGEVRQTHGAWQIICGQPPGAKSERCGAVQSVTAEDRPNVGLTVMLLNTVNREKKLLRVVAPLNVLLPSGLGLRVDEADIGRAPFVRCNRRGCVAEVIADKKLTDKLAKGKTAMFIIFETPEQGIAIPISLSGFSAAFKSLK